MRVTLSRRVECSPEHLWSVLTVPSILEQCHPFCDRNPVERWPGIGATDRIHYYGGRAVVRHFTDWLDGLGYDVVVTTPAGVEQALVAWRIDGDDDGSAVLTVTLIPCFADDLPMVTRWAANLVVWPMMRRYLQGVLAGVAHYAQTGRAVTRNQFGSHPWFSPRFGIRAGI